MDNSLIGKTIGQYHLIDRVGSGGMASVYRAYDRTVDRYVAIKILPFHLAANELLRQRFQREARMASRLQHPHILPIYDFGEEGDAPYIVMKLVEGGTLESFICEGPLSLRLVVRVVQDVAGALDYAHKQGVIHRDLKPENILFDVNGEIYLADFGVARLREDVDRLTGDGGFVGTAAYASPEQCRGEELSPASDIYSLGVLIYEMLTAQRPFQGPTQLAIMHQHMSETVPNPLKQRPELPLEINDLFRKAMAKLPGVRYQSASALSAALNEVLREQLGEGPAGIHVPPPGPNPRFEKPAADYPPPPPMPEDLLAELIPTSPDKPARLKARLEEAAAPAASKTPTPRPAPRRARIEHPLLLAALVILIALVVVAGTALLLLR